MRGTGERSFVRIVGMLVVVWAVAAVTAVAIRRVSSPGGRRALARTGRKLRFWREWLAGLVDELRRGCADPAVADDVVPRHARRTVVPLEDTAATS